MALTARIKPRARREINNAADWWLENRPGAPSAIDALLEQPGIGSKVENARDPQTRRLYLARTKYFVYYRVRGSFLEVVAFWHASREQEPQV